MTKPIPVHIYFVLDRSGSMQSIADDVIGGFDNFIAEQKKEAGRCRLTMIQFDQQDPHELLYDATEIAEVGSIAGRFNPRGMTPLLDAEGWMIARARQREADRKASDKKAEAILFVTLTDGLENASKEWTKEKLAAAKAEAEASGWAFTYLGCGHDSYAQARTVGTNAAAVQNFAADSVGTRSALADVSSVVRRSRSKAMAGERVASANLYDGVGKNAEADLASRSSS